MLDLINRHVLQPLAARKAGSRHLEYLRLLERTQFDSHEVVQARQLGALKSMLLHAWNTVPFYRRVWSAAGVHPSDVRSFHDLEALPILTKSHIRKHELDLVSRAFDVSKLRVKRTSGSTGVPLTIRIDEPAVQWKYACTLRSDQWSGWRLGQRVAKVWGNPEYRHFGWKGRLRNALLDRAVYLDTLNLNSDRIREFTHSIRRHRPGLIFGHAHSLYLLACQLKKAGVSDIRPHGIISTAMLLHDWQRSVIEQVFGCKVTNRYGCEEVSLIASECEAHQGLHFNSDSIYAEPNGGQLLVTDLTNHAMPLIRYQIGDVVVPTERRCTCGRGLPMIDRIEGREADYVVTPSGAFISGISLTENFALHIAGAAQVQIVQETLHDLRIRLVADEAFGDRSHRQIESLVQATFGPTMKYEVELVDAIPQEASGKYRFCISKVARERLQAMSA